MQSGGSSSKGHSLTLAQVINKECNTEFPKSYFAANSGFTCPSSKEVYCKFDYCKSAKSANQKCCISGTAGKAESCPNSRVCAAKIGGKMAPDSKYDFYPICLLGNTAISSISGTCTGSDGIEDGQNGYFGDSGSYG